MVNIHTLGHLIRCWKFSIGHSQQQIWLLWSCSPKITQWDTVDEYVQFWYIWSTCSRISLASPRGKHGCNDHLCLGLQSQILLKVMCKNRSINQSGNDVQLYNFGSFVSGYPCLHVLAIYTIISVIEHGYLGFNCIIKIRIKTLLKGTHKNCRFSQASTRVVMMFNFIITLVVFCQGILAYMY